MGRTVVAEEKVGSDLSNVQSSMMRTGLLVGQVAYAKDLIAVAVPTPSLEELGAKNEDSGRAIIEDDALFADWWVVEHASQVYGILPGGLNIIGVFVCCSSQVLPSCQARLAKILRDIGNTQEFKGHQPHQHLILVHYCTLKKKFKCQTMDTADPQAGFRAAEFKFKDHLKQWSKLEAVLSLDSQTFIPYLSQDEGLSLTQARLGVSSVLESVQTAIVTLRGRLIQRENDPLIKRSKKSQQSPSTEVVKAVFHLRRKPYVNSEAPILIPHARRVTLKGSISILAYVHPKATCAEAIAAVKQDACRSLVSHLQAVIEGFSTREGVMEDCLPARMALSLPTYPVYFTEYSLQHEDVKECCSRASELLTVASDSITMKPLEQFPPDTPITEDGHVTKDRGKVVKTYFGIVSFIATILTVLIAILLWIVLQ